MPRPDEPELVPVVDSIAESAPRGAEDPGDTIMAAVEHRDVPGPSSMFLPDSEHSHNPRPPLRSRSPTLPDLRGPSGTGTARKGAPDADAEDDDADDDDEVVARLPVYLSPALHPSLAMFQYPLQHRSLRVPVWAADRGKRITTRVKEGVGRVEIEVPVDADPKVWRDERARDLGFVPDVQGNGSGTVEVEGGVGGARGKKKAGAVEKDTKWGDKMRLRSENVPIASGTSHFSGIIHDGALHLHPISRVLQFRTAMSYLDDFDAKNRRGGSRGDEEEEKKKAASGAAARKDLPKALDDPNNDGSGSIKDFRNKMWSTAQREDEDKWVSYEWYEGQEEARVTASLEHLLVHEDRREMLECTSRGLDFLDRSHKK